ncbi:DUF2946 family protein [Accumulibacter sp.]|uniref:DUF2946 family protein n=1 Tax=Accumulibacter sp. TaxID=2053492 RepID=UPI0025F60001|nr:DUF2946 family protein [Accumulibacter sp.]MCM8594274.1 DUF2946 family protein [Accumulibacter sp.]MCM8627903.1 DUF2946 family protein [Accumulibacter sp.]MDS4048418.1 DUF2946 family protein [Accumulibacter sp.]
MNPLHRGDSPPEHAGAGRRWPAVPACYGWLSLDRRGRWRLRSEPVSHAGLIDFLNRRYTHDESGNYFVENGPQRVFVDLEYTPWVVHLASETCLETHVGTVVSEIRGAALDDEGSLLLEIPQGIGLVCDRDLPSIVRLIRSADGESADEASLLGFIERPPAAKSQPLHLCWQGHCLPLIRLRRVDVATLYGFVAAPCAETAG